MTFYAILSSGNFFRIRSAFAFGAKRLARLLDCPKEDLFFEVNQFFFNTWDRHGSGHRPDALRNDLWHLRSANLDELHESENLMNKKSNKKNETSASRENQGDGMHRVSNVPSQQGNFSSEGIFRASDVSTEPPIQSQRSYNSRTSDLLQNEINSNQSGNMDKGQRSMKADTSVNEIQGRFHFARTRSSPELTDRYVEVPSQGRRSRAPESSKNLNSPTRLDNSRRKNSESDTLASHSIRLTDDPSSVRHVSSRLSLDAAVDSKSASNSYQDESGLGAVVDDFASVSGTQGMHQEEQDLVNMMASSTAHGFNGQVHVPLNLASGHLPLPISPSILGSMGYAQRNMGGMVPTNFPLVETPWGTGMQFPRGVVPSPLTHYFSGMGLTSNPEDPIDPAGESFASADINLREADHDFWHEPDRASPGAFDLENGSFEMLQSDDNQQSTSAGYNFHPSSRTGSSGNNIGAQNFNEENQNFLREDHVDDLQYQDNQGNEVYFDERSASSRSLPATHSSSVRSKTSSESSWEGSSAKVSKSTREKRGRRTAPSPVASAVYGKGKSGSEHSSSQADDDNRDWSLPSTIGTEIVERSTGPQSASSLHVSRHQIPGYEPAQTSGSDSMIPLGPMLLGPSSRQRAMDNSGVPPITFYATGPPVFFTMLPVYNFPTEAGTSDASHSHCSREGGPNNSDSGQNFDSSEGLDQNEVLSASDPVIRSSSGESSELKSDILNGDFASHWQNLQYGRSCQNSQYPTPMVYPSPVVVPPGYLQGRIPWDGSGRPLSTDMNLFTQFMSYGPRLVPVTPLQSLSNRPTNVYQRYVDEMPRYRAGTGTYLPNPVR